MKISIITPALNSENFIEGALNSIHLWQPGGFSIEHIIVDGGSRDRTIDIIKLFKEKHDANIILLRGKDNNMYDAINKGLKIMTGDIWACLNTDDQYKSGIISEVINEFNKSPEIDVVYGEMEYIDENGRTLYSEKIPRFNLKNLVIAKGCFGIHQPAMFLRKSVIQKAGYFDIKYNYASDYDYLIRIGYVCNMKQLHKIVTRFRVHQESLSLNKKINENFINESEEITERYIKKFGINKRNIFLYIGLFLNQMIYEKMFFKRNLRQLKNFLISRISN